MLSPISSPYGDDLRVRAGRAFTPIGRNTLLYLRRSFGCITAKRLAVILVVVVSALLLLRAATHQSSAQITTLKARPVESNSDKQSKARLADGYGKLELSFIPNKGQTDQQVKFLSHGPGYDLFLTNTEAVLTLRQPGAATLDSLKNPSSEKAAAGPLRQPSTVLRLKMIGAEKDPRVSGVDELQGKVNYFVGNDPSAWHVNIPTYRKVSYAEIFPGVDLVYYGNSSQLEYDFVVAPGADIRSIKFEVNGAETIKVSDAGNLHLWTKQGDVQLSKPQIYQLNESGAREYVDGHYVVKGKQISFKVGAFDKGKVLVIDPVLSYSTLLGTGGSEQGNSIAVDSQGNAYITGVTNAGNFPTTAGALQTTGNFGGVFVSKLDATGSNLIYSTYLSGVTGHGPTVGTGIAIDAAGNAYVTGYTSAADFPTVNPLRGGRNNLLITTNSGANWAPSNIGTANRAIQALAIDKNSPSTIYAGTGLNGGIFKSTDGGATWTALNTGLTNASCPAIVIDPSSSNIIYAALIAQNFGSASGGYKSVDGGNTWTSIGFNGTQVSSLAIDPQNSLTLYAGTTFGFSKSINGGATWVSANTGLNFGGASAIVIDPTTPTTLYTIAGGGGVFKSTNGAGNWSQVNNGLTSTTVRALVIDPTAPSILYAGTAGGGVFKTTDAGASWAAVNNGPSLSTANMSSLAIVPGSPATVFAGTFDGRILKTTNAGSSWSVVYTTTTNTGIRALAVDAGSPAKVVAGVDSTIQALNAPDAFVTKLNPSGSALIYSTLIGGLLNDEANAIAIDATGNAYIAGLTSSSDYPTANASQPSFAGATGCSVDAFITKLNSSGSALSFSTYLGGAGCDAARAISLDNSGNVYVAGETTSSNLATAGAFQTALAAQFGRDAFAARLSPAGSLGFFTYLGGTGDDIAYGIATDSSGNAYVTGLTTSTNYPTANPIQSTNGGSAGDAFVTKINSTGSGLVYSTYLGGSTIDGSRGIAVDSAGSAYVTGFTRSPEFPLVAGALRTKSPFFKSNDGGVKWNNDNYGLKVSNILTMAVNPASPSTIFAGSFGKLHKSTDGGRNWVSSMNGLVNPTVRGLAINPASPSIMYLASDELGASRGVFKSIDSGNTWTPANNGLPASGIIYIVMDPLTPSTLYAGTGFSLYKSTDSGGTWNQVGPLSSSVALAIDPVTPSTLYSAANISGGKVSKSTDGGATWQVISNGYTGSGVSFLAIDPQTPSTVYASGFNGGLFKTVDGGANWTSIHVGLGGPIAIDPVNPSIVYGSSSSTGVFKSTDGGNTFTALSKAPALIFSLVVNPVTTTTLYGVGNAGDEDAFVTKLSPSGTSLIYSTLLGGTRAPLDSLNYNDLALAIALDSNGNAYVTGLSRSPDFPASPESYQPFNRGFDDAFVAKLTTSYIINGQVLDGSNAPVSGVEIVLNDGGALTTVTTESDGSYQFSHLREGGSFVVTASKPQFTMSPSSHTFNTLSSDQTANFTASSTGAPFYTLGGQVTENGVGRANVTVTLSGSQPGLRITDASGNYSFTLAGGGNYTVTPSALGFSFSPVNHSVNNLSANQTANFAANRQNFVVTNVNDHGAGSLRQAILDANATVGLDTIVFNIPGSGVRTINLFLALPEITDPTIIDAATQPGYVGTPLIELNGAGAGVGASGFKISSGSTTIRGFVINRFNTAGIELRTGGNNVIQGNYIGIDSTGTIARANHTGILFINSSNNTFGGLTPAARNVMSANAFHAISGSGSNNLIQGNFIGTNAAGSAALGNGINGIELFSSSTGGTTNNVIGGTAAGAGNLISGNQTGIRLNSTSALIQGNRIGTDVTGTVAVPNAVGINASNFVSNPLETIIGGTAPGARNVISGNTADGVVAGGGVKVQGNFIGTDITGTLTLGNGGNGVVAGNAALIGGTTPAARNVISGNGGFGNVSLGSNSSGNGAVVQGNYIGTDVTGTIALVNPLAGISISSNNNLIGGLVPGAGNIISGNRKAMQVGGNISSTVLGNIIQGNIIGLNASGTGPLPNTLAGIEFSNASNNTVGGSQSGAANTISFNGGPGVMVFSGTGNVIHGNAIFSNNGLGIDLGAVMGVTPNDLNDTDTGANNVQNFPILTTVSSNGGSTTIQGTLNSIPNTSFRIDFYSIAACDPSGNGEGARFFDTTNITTDANGNASINFVSSVSLPSGKTLTATATDPSGNTSEFSACDSTNLSGSVQFSAAKYDVLEDVGNATVNVVRTGGSKGTLSINYTTADGTATAGSDYTASSGTLVFAEGETSKTILIPIANDGVSETDETVRLSLTGFTDLETLGSYPVATIVVHENSTPLQLAGPMMDVIEGNSGNTNAVVPIYLSAQTSRNVSVNYSSVGFTATSGIDFAPVSGTLNFAAGETVKNIIVPVNGDTRDEFNEDFGIALTNAINATVIVAPIIFIIDDDPLPSISITDIMVNEGNSGTASAVFNVTLSAPSGKPVSVQFNTANGTATSGSDYTATSGLVSFSPGQISRTITVQVNGDTTAEPNETFLVNLFSPAFSTLSKAQGIATILDDEGQTPLELILQPGSGLAAAVDSLLFVRDPFTVLNRAPWFNPGSPNTKVLVFLRNLQLNQGETASAVEINLVSGSFTATIAAEDVRSLPNTDLVQVTFPLPDNLPAGICVVSVKVHGQSSNTGAFIVQ